MEEIKGDIDKIMDFLRSLHGTDVHFADIAKNTSLTHERVRRLVHLLEEKRQVKVEYHFASERVRWIGREKKTEEQAGIPGPAHERARAHIGERTERRYPDPSIFDQAYYPYVKEEAKKTQFPPLNASGSPPPGKPEESGAKEPENEALAPDIDEPPAQTERSATAGPLDKAAETAAMEKIETEKDGILTPQKEQETPAPQKPPETGEAPVPQKEAGLPDPKNLPPRLAGIDLALGKTGFGGTQGAYPASAKGSFSPSSDAGMPTAFALQTAARIFPKPMSMKPVSIPQPVRVEFVSAIPLPPMTKRGPEISKMSEKLKRQVGLIGAKSRKIAKLEEEKRRLLLEVYQPLEHKLDEDVQRVSGKLLDFERRILDLHAHAVRLPEEMEDVAAQQTDLAEVSAQLQQVYDETTHVVSEALTSLNESRESMSRHVELISAGVQSEERHLSEMTDTANALCGMQAEVEARLSEARQAIEDEQARLAEADEKLAGLVAVKTSLEAELYSSSKDIRTQKLALFELERHISRLDDVHAWVKTNREEYDRKMSALADYIKNAQGDYAALKESIDSSFAGRYLAELRNLSLSYEFEYAQAHRMEEDIDARLSHTKEQITALVSKAKSIADLQETQLAEISGPAGQRARDGIGRAETVEKAFLQDKKRKRMRELILRTIEEAPELPSPGGKKEERKRRARAIFPRAREEKRPRERKGGRWDKK